MSWMKIPVVYADREDLRLPFVKLVDNKRKDHLDKGGFILATPPGTTFELSHDVLEENIKFRTQVKDQIMKGIYEVQNKPLPEETITIRNWIKKERHVAFKENMTVSEICSTFWEELMPNPKFNEINYSNGNLKSLFPGKM